MNNSEGQTQEPIGGMKCNGNCGMNYCDEYGCIENKAEGDVSHLLAQPPAPIDVDALANKHADKIIEMGWRDKPDRDDIIADFKSGYYEASLPQSSTEEEKDLWIGIFKIVSKHILKMSKVNEVITELQPTYKISKR